MAGYPYLSCTACLQSACLIFALLVVVLSCLLRHPYPHPDMVFLFAFGLELAEIVNAHWLAIDHNHLLTAAVIVVQWSDLAFSAPEICVWHYSSLLIARQRSYKTRSVISCCISNISVSHNTLSICLYVCHTASILLSRSCMHWHT